MLGVGKADWGDTGGCIEVHSVYSRNRGGCSAHWRLGCSSRCTGDKIYRLSYALCVLHVGDCDQAVRAHLGKRIELTITVTDVLHRAALRETIRAGLNERTLGHTDDIDIARAR